MALPLTKYAPRRTLCWHWAVSLDQQNVFGLLMANEAMEVTSCMILQSATCLPERVTARWWQIIPLGDWHHNEFYVWILSQSYFPPASHIYRQQWRNSIYFHANKSTQLLAKCLTLTLEVYLIGLLHDHVMFVKDNFYKRKFIADAILLWILVYQP